MDSTDKVALEAAHRFAVGLASCALAANLGGGRRILALTGQGDRVDRAVELAVPTAAQAVAVRSTRRHRDWRAAGEPRELRVGSEPIGPGDLADQLSAGDRPDPGLGDELRGCVGDHGLQFLGEGGDRAGQFADAAQLVTRNTHSGARVRPSEPPGELCLQADSVQATSGQLQFRPEIVQVPAQIVD